MKKNKEDFQNPLNPEGSSMYEPFILVKTKCDNCKGKGKIRKNLLKSVPCPICNGTGKNNEDGL